MTRLAGTLAISLLLAACAGPMGQPEFSCPGRPDSPTCLSVLEVYEASDGDPDTATTDRGSLTLEAPDVDLTALPKAGTPAPAVVEADLLGPGALRTPSRVMRIWFAPWEDAEGDLNLGDYVFTEMEARRWTLGGPAWTAPAVIAPLQVEAPAAPPAAPPATGPEHPRTR